MSPKDKDFDINASETHDLDKMQEELNIGSSETQIHTFCGNVTPNLTQPHATDT